MKYLYPFILFYLSLNLNASAQDYKVKPPDSLRFYHETSFGSFTENLKGLWFDSVSVSGLDTTYYNFGQFQNDNGCYQKNFPTFFGHKMIVQPDGTTFFFTFENDSITLKTQSVPGNQWDFFHFNNGARVIATTLTTDTQTWKGTVDSVKIISLSYIDSIGQPVPGFFTYGDSIIKLSKLNGIMLCPHLSLFPVQKSYTALPVGIFTNRELYNCLSGDTIQFKHVLCFSCQIPSVSYNNYIIGSVSYSANEDTIFIDNDTITNLNNPVINAYPGRVLTPGQLEYYDLYYTTICNHSILTMNYFIMDGYPADTCDFVTFEPSVDIFTYYEGMREPIEHYFEGSGCSPCNHRDKELNYFSRVGWNCSSFGNFYTNINFASQKPQLLVLTNNSNQFVSVKNASLEFSGNFILTDLAGKIYLLKTLRLKSEEEINIPTLDLAQGMYIISFINNGTLVKTEKFIKLN